MHYLLCFILDVDWDPQSLKFPELGVWERFVLWAELKVKMCTPSWRSGLCCKWSGWQTSELFTVFLSVLRLQEFCLHDSGCKWSCWEFSLSVSGWTAKVHRLTESKQQSPEPSMLSLNRPWTQRSPSPHFMCWPKKGCENLLGCWDGSSASFSLLSTSTPPLDNPSWHVGFDGIEVCWHPQNCDLFTLHKANQYELLPRTKHASDCQMMYSCLQYR